MLAKKAHSLLAVGAAEKKRLAREGRKLVASVLRLRGRLQRTAFALGRALGRLKDKAMLGALGYPSFRALCDTKLHISKDLADELVAIAENFSAKEAAHLSTAKAIALIDLAKTLPGEHTASGLLSRGRVKIGRRTVNVRGASAHELTADARAMRAVSPRASKGKGGVHLMPGEKHLAAALAHALAHRHVEASVKAIAGARASGARVRLELPMRDLAALAASIREAEA